MDIRLALIGLDNPQVGGNSANVVLVRGSVTAKDLHQVSSASEGSVTVLSLNHGDELGRTIAGILEPADLNGSDLSVGGIGQSVSELLLDELVLGQRLALKLLSVQRVLSSELDGLGQSAHGSPGDTVSGRVEAGEGALETGHLGEHVLHRDLNVVHLDHTGDGGSQSGLVLDGGSSEAGGDLRSLDKEASDLTVQLGPHNHEIGNRRVSDPVLGSIEHNDALLSRVHLGDGLHGSRVGTVVRLGETEAADHLAGGQFGQEPVLLLLGSKLFNGVHDQRRLHRHGRSVAGVDPLDLSGHETVSDRRHAGASVALDGCSEQTNLTHLLHDASGELLGSVALKYLGVELCLAEVSSSLSHGNLVLGEKRVQLEGILPVHGGCGSVDGGGSKASGSRCQTGDSGKHCVFCVGDRGCVVERKDVLDHSSVI
ncbi:uncharacterized protein YALI1_F31153g [Yarrowia lipolytica]|uniref:Uncharacterized protein n=1 Tax=Yarrowia lipolytica TaxID=4952 RepID=A0A1D8NPR7_YARLL|nr:hypothetical protein YALI1_F31153g [Yarrowia lipolytica]